ncbi:MAG: RNA methyltransferase [Planctomycetota bacterium]
MRRTWRTVVTDLERSLTARGRATLGEFSIEGTRLHERALRAGVQVERAVASERFRRSEDLRVRSLMEELESSGCELHVVPDEVIASLTEGRTHGELLGLVRTPAPPSFPDLLQSSGDALLLLVGVDLEEPGNVGALARTALAAGATAFATAGNGDPFHPKAVRTSMGSLFKLPMLRFDSGPEAVEVLAAQEIRTVAATSTGGRPLPQASLGPGSLAVILGGEAFGLPEALVQRCDERVTIPMASEMDSLSINAAAAILLYEVQRRRP